MNRQEDPGEEHGALQRPAQPRTRQGQGPRQTPWGALDYTALLVPVTTTLHSQLLHQRGVPNTSLLCTTQPMLRPELSACQAIPQPHPCPCYPVPWQPNSLCVHFISCSLPQASTPWLPQVLLHSLPRFTWDLVAKILNCLFVHEATDLPIDAAHLPLSSPYSASRTLFPWLSACPPSLP